MVTSPQKLFIIKYTCTSTYTKHKHLNHDLWLRGSITDWWVRGSITDLWLIDSLPEDSTKSSTSRHSMHMCKVTGNHYH